jgi:hypothetical protein
MNNKKNMDQKYKVSKIENYVDPPILSSKQKKNSVLQ